MLCPSDEPAGPAAAGRLVAILADGMGGHAGGALASQMVCENFVKAFADTVGTNRDRLTAALEAANEAIASTVSANPMLTGMGSTLVGVVFRPTASNGSASATVRLCFTGAERSLC